MLSQGLAPSVEHREESDLGAKVLGVSSDLEEGLRRRAEERLVDHALVLKRQGSNLLREGKDDVEVRHWQEVVLARLEPLAATGGLALGTMPVGTAVVGDLDVAALGACLDVPTEGGSSAVSDRSQNTPLGQRRRDAHGLQEFLAVGSDDVGHLQLWFRLLHGGASGNVGEQVEWGPGGRELPCRDVQIDRRRL